jgi:2',3'-cyclic-nucleotide 2'-phosphodiesterase/3'-nucleotidase
MRKKFFSLFIVFMMLFSSTVLVKAEGDNQVNEEIKTIDILTLNAYHGRLEADNESVGAAALATVIKKHKVLNPEGTILLDAGNALQGTSLSSATYGKSVVDFYNRIGMDAMCVGNHEFDWGVEKLTKTMEFAKFPLLSANIYENGKRVKWAKPYEIIEKNGVKIGVIGLIEATHKERIAKVHVETLEFKDAAEEANLLIPKVRKEGADIIVLLSNIPGITDAETNEVSGNLIELAKKVKGADAVVGSLHKTVCTKVNGIPVVEAYRYGEKIGHITLEFNIKDKKVINSKVELINVKIEEDKEVAEMINKYAEDLKAYNETVIGKTDKDLKRSSTENEIGNWSADSIRESAGTQIAFTNPGGLRADLSAGDITINDVYKVMPFPNTVVKGKMTGKQIKAFFEQCITVGVIPVSGIKVEYDLSREEGNRVVKLTLSDGTVIDENKTYTAATNNFLAGGKDGYTILGDIEWEDTTVLVRNAMIENVEINGGIKCKIEERVKDISKTSAYNFEYHIAA